MAIGANCINPGQVCNSELGCTLPSHNFSQPEAQSYHGAGALSRSVSISLSLFLSLSPSPSKSQLHPDHQDIVQHATRFVDIFNIITQCHSLCRYSVFDINLPEEMKISECLLRARGSSPCHDLQQPVKSLAFLYLYSN